KKPDVRGVCSSSSSKMRLNEFSYCVSQSLVLVPYEAYHVTRYHQWMLQPDILEATASEPLSLEEEFEMQRSWRNSDDKLTFIVLHRDTLESAMGSKVPASNKESASLPWQRQPAAELAAMIGDVNSFLIPNISATEEDNQDNEEVVSEGREFELEVMIAEPAYRGRGLGREAVQCLIAYLSEALGAQPGQLLAKIGDDNLASQRLFTGPGLRFQLADRQPVFRQATYRSPREAAPPTPPGWAGVLTCSRLPAAATGCGLSA
uniref:N-acetyltransferase domain-containing protein n=2 Tax=Macrostomum lignano TaxID=282301 RepID=A0A1I8INA9_9PLAT